MLVQVSPINRPLLCVNYVNNCLMGSRPNSLFYVCRSSFTVLCEALFCCGHKINFAQKVTEPF